MDLSDQSDQRASSTTPVPGAGPGRGARMLAAVTAAVVVAASVIALLALATTRRSDLAFTNGVTSTLVTAKIKPGSQACQGPIDVAAHFEVIQVMIGTYYRPGPALEATVRDARSGKVLARGRLRGGYPNDSLQSVRVGRVAAGGTVSMCVRVIGAHSIALFGSPPDASSGRLEIDGRLIGSDAQVDFRRTRSVSHLTQLEEMFERAALFNASWVGAWTFWCLLVVVCTAAPGALMFALMNAPEPQRRHPNEETSAHSGVEPREHDREREQLEAGHRSHDEAGAD
jgi:hypothetical protein